MRFFAALALVLVGTAAGDAATDPKLLLIEQKLGGFEDRDYAIAVEKTLGEFEGRTGLSLRPGVPAVLGGPSTGNQGEVYAVILVGR